MRVGRRLAVDVGKVRIGLAISDPSGMLASPLATVARLESLQDTATAVLAEIGDFSVLEIYVGLPLKLNGQWSPSTEDAVALGELLSSTADIPIRFIDERMTTVSAASNLRQQGRNSKSARKIIDQEAAAIILESALSQEKIHGQIPGKSSRELERP